MGYQVKGFDVLGLVMERLSMPFPCIQRKISVLFRRTYIFSLKNCIYVCTRWAGISEKRKTTGTSYRRQGAVFGPAFLPNCCRSSRGVPRPVPSQHRSQSASPRAHAHGTASPSSLRAPWLVGSAGTIRGCEGLAHRDFLLTLCGVSCRRGGGLSPGLWA